MNELISKRRPQFQLPRCKEEQLKELTQTPVGGENGSLFI